MNYTDYEINFGEAVRGLPANALLPFAGDNPAMTVQMIGVDFELVNREIGWLCELVRQVITRERKPEDFETGLVEKLDEDNREKVPGIVAALSEKIFAKLLPALGIKIPIELAVRAAPPKVEGIEVMPLPPAHPTQVKRMAPPPPSASKYQDEALIKQAPPLPASTFSKPNSLNLTPYNLNSPTPLVEPSHEGMSKNPLESLLQMLENKVTPNELSHQFERLPDGLKSVLGSVDSAKKVVDIGRKYSLHMDKLGELGAETGMVILGFTHPGQFLSRLTRRLDLPEEKVRPIAQEINNEVFLKIREALKQINGETNPETSEVQKQYTDLTHPDEQIAKPPAPAVNAIPIPIKPPATAVPVVPPRPPFSPPPQSSDSHFSNLQTAETAGAEEVLDRESIIQGIENPAPFRFNPSTKVVKTETPAPPTSSVSQIKSSEPTLPTVTPRMETPWKAVAFSKPDSAPMANPPAFVEKTKINAPPPTVPIAPATPIPKPETLPVAKQSIVDRKLAGQTSSTRSESRYTADPYREAAE